MLCRSDSVERVVPESSMVLHRLGLPPRVQPRMIEPDARLRTTPVPSRTPLGGWVSRHQAQIIESRYVHSPCCPKTRSH